MLCNPLSTSGDRKLIVDFASTEPSPPTISTSSPNSVSTGSLLRHSRSVVGFYLFHCLRRPEMFTDALSELFARAGRGELEAVVGQTYPLEQASQAHIDLRDRRSTGKLLLDPSA